MERHDSENYAAEVFLRIEHITAGDTSQFYVNCAHADIVGEGSGVPGPLAKIPGVYASHQPDVLFNPKGMDFNISYYVAPAPTVRLG